MMLSVEEEIDALVTADLLTERQATAFVHREVEATPRQATAEMMGIEPSTLDNYVAAAKRKVTKAQETAEAVEKIRNQLPDDE
jgi:DNA-directed RNA polymerase specialized sigma24 family protein